MPHSAKYNRSDDIEKQRIRDYQSVFNSAKGKDVLTDLVRRYNVMDSLQLSELTPEIMAYREGMRAVILDILNTLQRDVFAIKQEVADHERRNYDTG